MSRFSDLLKKHFCQEPKMQDPGLEPTYPARADDVPEEANMEGRPGQVLRTRLGWIDPPPALDVVQLKMEDAGDAIAIEAARSLLPGINRTTAPLTELKEATMTWNPKRTERQRLKDEVFCNQAAEIARLGTCCRLKVGCVLLAHDGKVVGEGFNGAGPGMPHCEPSHCNETCRCRRTRHAEKNALSNMSGKPWTAYLTHEPCADCAKDLIAEGVRRIVYVASYASIAPEEAAARQEWIDHYHVSYEQFDPEA